MSEEEKFECVFGLGECKALKWINEQLRASALSQIEKPPCEIPVELMPFMNYMESLLQKMATATTLGNLGYFCLACIELKKAQTELFKPK